MSHLSSPVGLRVGKTFLWTNNNTSSTNHQSIYNSQINLSTGLEAAINQILRKKRYWVVKLTTRSDLQSSFKKVNLLYYPQINPISRKRVFPVYCAPRNLLSKKAVYSDAFKKFIAKYWAVKNKEFTDRFVRTKARKNLNKWISKTIFKGEKLLKRLKKYKKNEELIKPRNKLICQQKNYATKLDKQDSWHISRKHISPRLLSKQIEKRTGLKVNIKAKNVFNYLILKNKSFRKNTHQDFIWNKKYHYNKKRFAAFYDVVYSLYLLCYMQNAETFVMRMIQYGLIKMHRRKIRPKQFFYFIDAVLKNMPQIRKNFKAFRVVITGKLRGGTSRTKTFSAGYGVMPTQSISRNVRYELGDVRSKYGSFGVKIFTWRVPGSDIKAKIAELKHQLGTERYLALREKVKNKALRSRKIKQLKLLKLKKQIKK
jgi:hypothetical protein